MTRATRMVQEINALGTGIPMVAPTSDPVPYGLSSNLARPDRNFTGVVLDAGLEIWGKRVQLLLEAARKLTKVGSLGVNPTGIAPSPLGQSLQVRDAAQHAGIAAAYVVIAGKFDRTEYERTFATVVVGGKRLTHMNGLSV